MPSARTVGATGALVVVLALAFGAVQLLGRSVPSLRYVHLAPNSLTVPGPAPALPFPRVGEATVGVLGVGTLGSSGGDRAVPIASLTKMMTAYLVLADHPLTGADQGPSITITAADVAAEAADAAVGQSVLKVAAGEQITERQALEGLLIPSANNIGTVLARWDGGSDSAFVARMNSEAMKLGMAKTHYGDPAGIDATTVSDAEDQVKLAVRAMENPVFAETVALPQITLPVAGTVFNYDFLIGHDGIIGIKTGSTQQAGGCFVFAAARSIAGIPTVIVGAVLGQRGGSIIQAALKASLTLIDGAAASLHPVSVSLPHGGVVARIQAPWARPVTVAAPGQWSILGWPGLTLPIRVSLRPLGKSVAAGARTGTVTLTLGIQKKTFAAVAQSRLPPAPLSWRLKRT